MATPLMPPPITRTSKVWSRNVIGPLTFVFYLDAFAGRGQHYFGAFLHGWLTHSEQGRYAYVKKRQPVLTAAKVSPRVQDRDRQRPSRAPQWLPAPEASR